MSEVTDLPVGWHTRSGEVHLLYLFGKSRSAPMFAIHDEDVLEYAHNVIARGSHVPSRFLGELQERILLLIGCDFPDWLSRFFLRVTNKSRLSEKDKREWMIEQLGPEESLTCFLRSYSTATEILPDTPPVQFVAELHRRWMAERAATPEGATDPRIEAVPLAQCSSLVIRVRPICALQRRSRKRCSNSALARARFGSTAWRLSPGSSFATAFSMGYAEVDIFCRCSRRRPMIAIKVFFQGVESGKRSSEGTELRVPHPDNLGCRLPPRILHSRAGSGVA